MADLIGYLFARRSTFWTFRTEEGIPSRGTPLRFAPFRPLPFRNAPSDDVAAVGPSPYPRAGVHKPPGGYPFPLPQSTQTPSWPTLSRHGQPFPVMANPFPSCPAPTRDLLPPDPCHPPVPPPSKSASNDGTLQLECTPSVMPGFNDDISYKRKPLSLERVQPEL